MGPRSVAMAMLLRTWSGEQPIESLRKDLERKHNRTADVLCDDLIRIASDSADGEKERLEAEKDFLRKSVEELEELMIELDMQKAAPRREDTAKIEPRRAQMVCRMLGEANGRTEFERSSRLRWSEDGHLDMA